MQDDRARAKETQELKGKASEAGQAARDYSQHVKAVGEKEIDKLRVSLVLSCDAQLGSDERAGPGQ
jgi:hypothetical protein